MDDSVRDMRTMATDCIQVQHWSVCGAVRDNDGRMGTAELSDAEVPVV